MSKEQSAKINGSPAATKPITEPTAVTDKVEKAIAEAEQNLATDLSLINEGKDPQYQDDSKEKILESLELLKNLRNVISDLKHPQAETIKKDIIQLEERVRKLQMDHERMYNSRCLERLCSDDWEKIIEEKQASLSSSKSGPDLTNMESQMKEHIAFHDEIEAWGPLIAQEIDKGKFADLQLKYDKLLVSSCARHQHLLTLRDYMVRCTVELFWMEQQAEERISNDWSDANLDYPSRQKQYEKFISKCLESKEITVSKLIDDGEALIAVNHPTVNVIQAHMEAVLAEWKDFRGLLTCEEKHLRNMEDYHRFHREARDVRDLLQRIDKELSHRYNPQFKDAYQIEVLISDLDDLVGAMDQHEKRVEVLQAQSQDVLPLKVRRKMPMELPLVEALCNFHTDQGTIIKGETYTLLSIGRRKWKVLDLAGCQLSAPSVCFLVPPTDPEAVALSQSIASLKSDIRENISRSKDILQKQLEELKKEKPGLSASEEQLCLRLMANLEKINNDLDKQEESIYTVLRPPLQQNNPFQDSTNRIRALRDIKACIKKIELEKKSKVQEAERLLNSHPKCAGAPQLYAKVNEADDKYNKVNALLNCAEDKFMNSSKLESSLSTIGEVLNTYEMTLAEKQVMPSDLSSLERLQEYLFTICSDLESKKSAFYEAEINLGTLRSCCEGMVSKVQEHCPDINRQQAEVHRLRRHQELVNKQVEARSKSLQKAKTALSNYSRLYNELNDWLCQLPSYEPQDKDNVQQLDSKLKEQRNLIADIARKQSDLQEVLRNAWLYQQAVEDYETQARQLNTFLDLEDGLVMKNINMLESTAPSLKNEESVLEHKFLEASAINKQRLQSLDYALNLLNQQSVPEQKSTQDEISLMEGQKPQDIIMRRKLEEEIQKVQLGLSEEQRLNRDLQQELELLSLKCYSLETEKREEDAAKETLSNGQDREQDISKAVNEAGFEKSSRELLEHIREETTKRKQTEEEVKLLQEKLKGLKNNEAAATIPETEKDKETEVQQLRNKILDKGHEIEKCNLEILKLRDEIQTCKAATLLVRTEEITKEVIQNHGDSDAKQELETLRQQLTQEESRYLDLEKEKSALQLQKTSLLQTQDNVDQQEVGKLKEDPLVKSERATFPESITNGRRLREALGDDLCELQSQNSDSDIQLEELEREQTARKRVEMEVQMLKDQLNGLEVKNKENDENIFKQNVALPQDSQDEREYILLKHQIQEERDKRILLEDKINSLLRQQATQENVVPSEEGKRDPVLEIEKLKKSLEEEKNRYHELNDHLTDVNCRLSDMENMNEDFNKELEEIHTINNNLYQENQKLKQEIERCGGEYQTTLNKNGSIANLPQSHNGEIMETQLASLQQELSNLKAIDDKKDQEIEELKKQLSGVTIKKEHRENYHRRAIRIIDPNTHQELKPEEACRWGLIDWTMSVRLQSQECDWEEITIRDPDGESSVLHDKKTGKWYSVEEALNAGNIKLEHVQQYHGDRMSIDEFGTMVSGRNK